MTQSTICVKGDSYLDNNSALWGSAIRGVVDFVRSKIAFIKFVSSSFSSYLVEYGLYSLLVVATGALVPSNVTARIISSAMNYWVNRKLVFHENEDMLKSAAKYFLLALIILSGNTLVLKFLVNGLGIHRMIAKIITDLFFFVVNYSVQNVLVFKRVA